MLKSRKLYILINTQHILRYEAVYKTSGRNQCDSEGISVNLWDETICEPFGKELLNTSKTSDNKLYYKYAGHEGQNENTGLTYMGARYLDNAIGRFISSDPAEQGLNWYIYAGNNPTTNIDPTGMYYLGGARPSLEKALYLSWGTVCLINGIINFIASIILLFTFPPLLLLSVPLTIGFLSAGIYLLSRGMGAIPPNIELTGGGSVPFGSGTTPNYYGNNDYNYNNINFNYTPLDNYIEDIMGTDENIYQDFGLDLAWLGAAGQFDYSGSNDLDTPPNNLTYSHFYLKSINN